VAFVALAPLLVALHGAGPRRGFRLAYVTGVVSSIGLLYWTALVVVQFGGLSLPLGIGVMLLLCLAFALFHGLFGALVGLWSARLGKAALLLAPLAWVAAELLRAHTLCRFAWCLLGYSQADHESLIQVASFTAVYGVSFLVSLVSAAIAYLVVETRPAARLRAAVAVAALGRRSGASGAPGSRSRSRNPAASAWAWFRPISGRRTSGRARRPSRTWIATWPSPGKPRPAERGS
jgi:apolipoprotein N-acyltransferase